MAWIGRCWAAWRNAFLGGPGQRAGHLGCLSRETVYDAVVAADEILNINKAYPDDRFLLLSPSAKAAALLCDKFVEAQKRGDGGKALRTAELGSVLGFQSYMFQNVPSVLAGADVELGTVTAAHAAGSQDSMAVSISDAVAGEFCVVAGNDQPTWISAVATSTGATHTERAERLRDSGWCGSCSLQGLRDRRDRAERQPLSGRLGRGNHPQELRPGAAGRPTGGDGLGVEPEALHHHRDGPQPLRRPGEIWVLLDRPLEIAVNNGDPVFPGPMGRSTSPGTKTPGSCDSPVGYDPRRRNRVRRRGGLRRRHPCRHAAPHQQGPRGRR